MPQFIRRAEPAPPPLPSPTNPAPISPQESAIDAQTITTVIQLAPSTSPISAKAKSGVPEIGGSEGGFIGLVVGLSVIMVASCIGVFYLLKYRGGGGNARKRAALRDVEGSGPQNVGGAVEMKFPPQGRFTARGRGGWARADSLGEYGPLDEADVTDERERNPGHQYQDYKRALEDGTLAQYHHRQSSVSSAASTVRQGPLSLATALDKVDDRPGIDSPDKDAVSPRGFEPTHGRRATDESTLVSPTSIAHPYGVGGSKFHEIMS